ncbi:putative isomerase [Colletotrichum orbiculare MAFF 240422]|uniref:Isomerase n=1 Tax=Colletotrichum orbiculare (strain 104-T / ATCC 96160 / CBS 514.97 / LARS 414 / MAFF 240422) TaxID=1213857 RepID=N4UWG7_COLOR|nr:putative isomerase [Colletotrichum orbiculare MAFF 240422]
MELPFTTVDVFTDTPFQGNQLAIVTIPAGTTLSQAQKQAIACEFNYSETTFVHEEGDATSPERRFDIFTTTEELPFAGHPTIGTAVSLQPQGVTTLHAKAGRIGIESTGHNSVRAAIPHNVRLHAKRLRDLGNGPFSSSAPAIAAAEKDAVVFSIVKGMTFILTELPSLEALAAVRICPTDFRPAELLDEGWRDTLLSAYYFVRLGAESVGGRTVQKIRTRMVTSSIEDPATGSAASALTAYLSLYELSDQSASFEITQGVEMGRESHIYIDTGVDETEEGRILRTLHLGGKATQVIKGVVSVPV